MWTTCWKPASRPIAVRHSSTLRTCRSSSSTSAAGPRARCCRSCGSMEYASRWFRGRTTEEGASGSARWWLRSRRGGISASSQPEPRRGRGSRLDGGAKAGHPNPRTAMHEEALRSQLVRLLVWGDAHATFENAVDGLAPDNREVVPPGAVHSAWQLLEHLRLTQRDILEFCRNPAYREPHWPDDYWPDAAAPPDDGAG